MEPLPYLQEVEMIHLSRDIPHTSYSELCVAMGYAYNRNQSILASHRRNYNEAVTEILIKWNTEQADTSQSRLILATKLHAVNLGGLGKKLSKGEYLPKQQDPYEQEETPLQSSSGIYSKQISPSLTVQQCREKLQNKYLNQLCKIQMKPWDQSDYAEFKDMHTVVTLVNKYAHGKGTKKKKILKGSVAEIFSTKVNGRLPARILISAPVGRGKTTAVAKMAYDWVHRERGSALEHLPLLFVVKFRNTTQLTSIGEAIKSQLLSDVDDLTPEGLESFIRENQGICHIILDGLDEYAGISSLNQSLGSNIVSVIRCEEFPECRVLVTTRPHLEYFFHQAELPRVYTTMWIEGFSQESSREYIDKFFASTSNRSREHGHCLKVYLDDQPLINELVKTPLFCLMFCHLWSEGLVDTNIVTQTKLLDSVNVFLLHHANAKAPSRDNITEEELIEIIRKLGKVALAGLIDDSKRLVFTPHDFRKVPAILDRACELGILNKTTIPTTMLPLSFKTTSTTIEFYHKLVQEHSAGKYLAAKTEKYKLRLKISKLDRLLHNIEANIGDYENLLRFAVGTDNSLCIRIMEALLSNRFLDESERYRILLDCSSETKGTEVNVSSLVRRCVTAQSIVLKSPTVYTVVGMSNLPNKLKHEVETVKFEGSALTTDVTNGLWSCLRSFTSLNQLIISDSSLSFPPSPPELPSFTKLSGERMTPFCYEGVLLSIPGVREIDVFIDVAEHETGNTFQITTASQPIGQTRASDEQFFVRIRLLVWPALTTDRKIASGQSIGELSLLFGDQTRNQQRLHVSGVKGRDEEALVDLFTKTKQLTFLNSGSGGGSLSDTDTDQITSLKIQQCQLSTEMTEKLWSCLRSFTSLNQLSISDSSLRFPPSPPELPSVTKLSAERVTSQSYEGLLPSLPGLRDIDIIIDDAERDIPEITAWLRRTGGQQLTHIKLIAPPSLPSGKNCVSGETMRGLDSLIKEQITNLQWLGLSGMKSLDEEDFVELVESSTYLKALDSLHLKSIDYESFKYDRQSDVQCLYFTRRDHEKILEGFARRTDEVLPSTTETSPETTLSSSQGPSAASTSVDIHFQDASVAAGEISTSKARVPSIEEQHEDEGTAETSPETTLSSSQIPSAASTSVDIPPQDASVAAAEVSTSKARVPSIEEQHEDEEIDPEEAIRNGMAPWNRSRIMVIGPAGVGKTSLIRRLTGQKFNPEEKSTKGAEQNVVTQSAVSRWALVNDDQTAKGDLIQSIATMDPNFRSNISSSTGEEENRSDPAITAKGDLIQSIATMEDPTFGGSISSSTGRGENRSDPAVTAKDDLIQSIATMEDPNFGGSISCSPGGEENRRDPAITGKDDLIQSIATMEDPNFGGSISCSPGGEENRRDPAITERRGVELETDQDTTLELPSTSSQQPMIQENEISTREHRQIAESDTGHVEEPTESKMKIQNRGSKLSTPGAGDMSEATKYERDVIVSPTINNEKIAKLSQGITREEITKVKSSALDITYSMWDFGGQEIYYITHPLFLSWRSLYILVIPLHLQLSDRAPREEDAQDTLKQLKGSTVRTQRTILELIHFWLMSVYTHAVPDSNLQSTYEPKVLLIGTFAGDEGLRINEEKVTAKFKELKDRLGSNPYWKQVLSPMCWIDNQFSIESEVNKIQDCIDGLIKDSAYMEVQMPIKWRTFSTEIADSDQNTLTVTEAHSIMTNWGMNDLEEVKAVLKFYHDIGHLIYHQGCELIVLKPQFLNSIVSNIITVIDDKKMDGDLVKCWTDLKEKGILHIKLIQAVWEEHKGDHGQLDNIIDLMIKFDLICKIPDGPREEKRFFVPCRSSPELHKREILDKDDKVEFTIDFHHFLPDGFLHRFYVRMAQWSMERMESIKPTFHCREMVFYIDNGHRVVMTNDIHEDCEIKIMIYTVVPYGAPSGREPATVNMNTDIIDFLHATLNDLKELWARRIEYRVGIWCPRYAECGCKGWIHIRDILKSQDKTACCDEGCAIYVGGILEAFSKGTTETSLGGASAAAGEVTTSTTRSTDESREQDFDDLLKTVAKKIHRDIDIDNLGKELGFEPAEITRYIQTNEKYRTVTYMGTLSMLRDWRNKTTRSKERQQMRKALIAIGHNHVADDLLNDDLAN